jgi:hypothetical protein
MVRYEDDVEPVGVREGGGVFGRVRRIPLR